MLLILLIDIIAIAVLVRTATSRGLERALPAAAFVFVLVPRDAAIPLPGLFDLTTQRVILGVLALLFISQPSPKLPRSRVERILNFLIVAHIIWCLLVTVHAIDPLASFKKMASAVFEYYLLYYIFVRTIKDIRTVNRVVLAVASAIIGAAFLGFIEAYWDWNVMQLFPRVSHYFEGWTLDAAASGRERRVMSTFAHPILFGAGLTMGIVLALYLIKVSRVQRQKYILWAGLLLMFLSIYKTSSRGPWLGMILSLLALLAFDKGRVRKYLTAIGALVGAVLLIRPGVWLTLVNIYIASFDPNSPVGTSYEYRFVLRDLVLKAVSKDFSHAMLGYGMESFYSLRLEGILYGKPHLFLSCDSAWLELLIETGYVGLVIICGVLLVPLWFAWKDAKRSPDRVQLYFAVVMLGNYFMMLSVGMYGWGQTSYILWMVIALSVSLQKLKRTGPSPDPLSNRTAPRREISEPSPPGLLEDSAVLRCH